jgi:hypothetical protein
VTLTMMVTHDAMSVTGESQISLMTSSKKTYQSLSSDTTKARRSSWDRCYDHDFRQFSAIFANFRRQNSLFSLQQGYDPIFAQFSSCLSQKSH